MSRARQILLVSVGVALIAFAALAALYAGDLFNIATIGGAIGVGLIAWAVGSRKRRSPPRS